MKIDSVNITPPLALAPMAGVTDLPYRQLIAEMGGCGLIYTEMVSAKGLVYGNSSTEDLLAITDSERPVAVQLFGAESEIIQEAAQIVVDKADPEIIDLNVGCPAPKVVKNGYGSALMKDPELLGQIVAAMSKAVSTPVTVKIRAGWDEETINAIQIAKVAADNGAQMIGVHGRTREQFYEGKADWNIIKGVKKAVSIPVFGNGDVFAPEDAEKMINQTGCDGVLIARAARGYPWIFKNTAHYIKTGELLPSPRPEERIDKAVVHLNKLVDYKGEYVGVREMRKHAAWYIKGLRNCTKVKDKINKAGSQQKMKEILLDYKEELKMNS